MIKIFDLMLDQSTREAFIEKKGLHVRGTNKEYEALKEYIFSDECTNDIIRLRNGDYFFDIPEKKLLKKRNSTKVRTVYIFPDKNKFLLKLMSYCLNSYDFVFSKSLYSFRVFRNHTFFFKKARIVDRHRTHYVFKTDVHAYSDSMDPDVLFEKVTDVLKEDEEICNFIKWYLGRQQYYFRGELYSERFALCCGTPISSFFCNCYLKDLDKIFERGYPIYMRFSDDIAVFTNTREEAEKAKQIVYDEFKKIHLTVNEEKTYIFNPGEAFTILGFQFGNNEIDIAPGSLNKILSMISRVEKKLLKQRHHNTYTQDQVFHYAEKFQRLTLYGSPNDPNCMSWAIWTFGTITTDKSLKIIDNRLQNFLRRVYVGKETKARYRMTYQQLVEKGYQNLVHRYHHRAELIKEREDKIVQYKKDHGMNYYEK